MLFVAELVRLLLEELEAIEVAVAARLVRNPGVLGGSSAGRKRPHVEVLTQQHELALMLKQYAKQSAFAERLTTGDYRQLLQDEVAAVGSPDGTGFDRMLREINSHFDAHPEAQAEDVAHQYSMGSAGRTLPVTEGRKRAKKSVLSAFALAVDVETMFTEEEAYGRYVDMHRFHQQYVGIAGEMSYGEYLAVVGEPPAEVESHPAFALYAAEVASYLQDFHFRTSPVEHGQAVERLREQWKASAPPDSSVWCGVCCRLFAKPSVYDGHLVGKKHRKAVAGGAGETPAPEKTPSSVFTIQYFCPLLLPVLSRTRHNAARRQALTPRERALELQALEGPYSSSLESEGDVALAEESLPLGSDGKPIPFWLYKLQGLSKRYACEICSNAEYRGRKQFAAHFGEPQHAYGLRCLGIEPGPAFRGITSVREASDLWAALRRQLRSRELEQEAAVEVEDEEGNVMEQRVYEDLKRQGLV